MKVSLVSTTQAQIDGQNMTAEQLVVYIARVSNPNNQSNIATADRLIAYLVENKHWSPFEMVDMCVRIETSRAIAAQILRHRSFSFQEFSQRYAKVEAMEEVELREQADKNRQSSTEKCNPIILCPLTNTQRPALEVLEDLKGKTMGLYTELLDKGVAKEVARLVLPLRTQTTLYMKGSLRSWIHYLQIRCDEHTQKEHRLIANEIKALFVEQFPNVAKGVFPNYF
jgi:thymidylate synthase (FAD)